MKFISMMLVFLYTAVCLYSNTSTKYTIISEVTNTSILLGANERLSDDDINFGAIQLDSYFFEITTTDKHVVLTDDIKLVLIMPNTRVVVRDNVFYIDSGYAYFEALDNIDSIEIYCSNYKYYGREKDVYTLSGKSFAMTTLISPTISSGSNNSSLFVHTRNHAMRIEDSSSLGIRYLVEPYHETQLLPKLESLDRITMLEAKNLDNAKNILLAELENHLNREVQRETITLFKGTKYETDIYRIVHQNKGTNVFIFVPHGDERYSTVAALNRIVKPIKAGSITIVPIGLTPAYNNNSRGYRGIDLNRQFGKNINQNTEIGKVAYTYAKMLEYYNIDLVITLHEGNGKKEFFSDAIVFDKAKYQATSDIIVERINKRIEPTKYKFKSMLHPMPTTFTYYAAEKDIDAFCVEVSGYMPEHVRAVIKNAIIDEFFKMYGLY